MNVADVMAVVMQRYDASGGVERRGRRFRTRPTVAGRAITTRKMVEKPLSRAAQSISDLASHQPITRAEIEEIVHQPCQKAPWIFCRSLHGLSRVDGDAPQSLVDMGNQFRISTISG